MCSKPKVLFCIESLSCGGAEKSLLSLLNNLNLNKYKIDILVYKTGGEFENFIPESIGLKSIGFKPKIMDRIKFKLFKIINFNKKYHNAQIFWKSTKKSVPTNNGEYDVAVAWGQGFATYFVSEKIKASRKFAWVNTDYKKAGYNASKDQLIYKEFRKIIGVSPFVQQELKKIYPLIDVIFIRDIVDQEEVVSWSNQKIELKFNDNEINIVSVGRLAKPKSFDSAINAIKIVRDKGINAHLYIIGEGPERFYLESHISNKNLDGYVTLLGYKENPFPYIKNSDIYLQSSIFEGLGRTLIEAAILKKPIVTTNFPTASQILINNETGLIVEMKPESIAIAIINLINNEELKNGLIANLDGQSQIETQKSLDAIYELFDQSEQI